VDLTEGIMVAAVAMSGSTAAAAMALAGRAVVMSRRTAARTNDLPTIIAEGDGNGNEGTTKILEEVRGAREEARQTRVELGALHRDLTGLAERQDACRRHGDERYAGLQHDVETLKARHWATARDAGGR